MINVWCTIHGKIPRDGCSGCDVVRADDNQGRCTATDCGDEWQPAHAAGSRPEDCATCTCPKEEP